MWCVRSRQCPEIDSKEHLLTLGEILPGKVSATHDQTVVNNSHTQGSSGGPEINVVHAKVIHEFKAK